MLPALSSGISGDVIKACVETVSLCVAQATPDTGCLLGLWHHAKLAPCF